MNPFLGATLNPQTTLESDQPRSLFRRYAIAVLSTALALGLSLLFRDLFEGAPFLLFWGSVAVSAWYGGLGPGLLATILTVVAVNFFLVVPFRTFQIETVDFVRLLLFTLISGVIGLLYDKRRQTEAALRQTTRQLDVILRGVADGITVQDRAGRLIYANDAAARLLGFASSTELLATPVQEVLGRFEMLDEQGGPFPQEQLPGRRVLQGLPCEDTVIRFRIRAEGEERWSVVKATPVVDDRGEIRFAVNLFQDITRLKRIQQSLHEQGEWLRVTLSGIGDGVIATDTQGAITFINPAACELTGWDEPAALGQAVEDVFRIVREDTDDPVDNPARRALIEGTSVGLANHTQLIRRDGLRVAIDDSGAPIWDASGSLIGGVLVFRDITERRKAEARLHESEARFRNMADHAPVLIWMTGTDPQRSYFNKTWLEYTGRSSEQEQDGGWAAGLHPEDAARCRDTYASAFEARQPFSVEYRLKNARGEYRWLLERGVPRYAQDGSFEGYIGSCVDITERKEAEETRRFLAAIVENADDAIFGKTLDGILLSWNQGAERMYGYTPEEVIGQSVSLLMPANQKDELRAIMDKIKRGEPIERVETRRVRKDGVPLDISLTVSPIRDDSGTIIGASTIARDITQRKKVEALEREQRILAEALRDTANALNSALHLEEVLDRILDNIERVVPHDAAEIMLIESGSARIVRSRGYAGDETEQAIAALRLRVSEVPSLRQMVETRQPVIVPELQDGGYWATNGLAGEEWHSYTGAPIYVKDEIIGFINLISTRPDFFTPVHADRLQAFAEQAAIAIQNARLHEQEQALAALQERQRLARDLHDAVSQTLFSASVVAEALARQHERDPQKVGQRLNELHQLTRGALAEMRTLLLELRPNSLVEVNFGDLLLQLADAVQSRKRIAIQVSAEDVPDLPPDVKLALYRIVQEALNNVAKHARATRAEVHLRREGDQIELSVRDNGRGFEMDAVQPTSMGLSIMRERAEAVDASLVVHTQVGSGTEIIVTWTASADAEYAHQLAS